MQPVEEAHIDDTMLYRAEGPDSVPGRVGDVWGNRLEMIVVSASEVEQHLSEGWVRHPSEVEGAKGSAQADPAKVDEAKSDVSALKEAADALDAANQREADRKEELQQAVARAEAAEAEVAELKELIAAFDADNDGKPGGSKKKG